MLLWALVLRKEITNVGHSAVAKAGACLWPEPTPRSRAFPCDQNAKRDDSESFGKLRNYLRVAQSKRRY
jgi:hypothetical protein